MNIEEMQAQRDADYETYKAEGRIWGIVPREKIARIRIPRTSKEVIDRYYALEDMSTAVRIFWILTVFMVQYRIHI